MVQQAVIASLDPATFRHEMAENIGGFQISQVNYGFQIRSVSEIHIPCVCGRPLVGCETDWIHDQKGSALYFKGVCLHCGLQDGLYLSAPTTTPSERDERVRAEIQALVERITLLREASPSDEPQLAPVIGTICVKGEAA